MKNDQLERLIGQAIVLDEQDPLKSYISKFARPHGVVADLRGNSLGFMPRDFSQEIYTQARVWSDHGHNGHFHGDTPWWLYHEQFEPLLAELLGCDQDSPEAVVGGTLSHNNLTMLTTFLRYVIEKSEKKTKILTIKDFFPSDIKSIQAAVWSVLGSQVNQNIVYIDSDENGLYDMDEICEVAEKDGGIGLAFLPVINYKTGQRFAIQKIAQALSKNDAILGLDLAHGIGNIPLHLNRHGVAFATWCGYKYLNGGPGAVGGIYVHKDFHDIPDAGGWWGLDKETRFGDPEGYTLAKGARRFLLSNDPIFNMQGVLVQLKIIQQYSFQDVVEKHKALSSYLYELLETINTVKIVTPKNWNLRGCQISFQTPGKNVRDVLEALESRGLFCEDRGVVLRAAPVGYNTYSEVALFAEQLNEIL